MTFDQVPSSAEAPPRDEQALLADLLRKRRIEVWRQETAAEARKAVRAFPGKLKAEPVETVDTEAG